ncbi:polymerase delta-interacting protein 3 [Teleopsis dalmanni]|uniref:polymerase delta-interacting protein 3 n=1 Tax=Teleopsis dalmanni TaxID=139649 RepID=UPI0018CDF64E|nr:polymerase delta-interacting protein 3 [Teleopsis dalmanni]XP_037937917.1 polymerase delta-interacting protein 3 [Teleopsis dalmanni]XP_037937918.1 polymerase delta-interacting protein 3 [Teleopsis dalmanni]XP_037937919.1 polymerase delta-interacting protein 3 [Teleopsis dalmanni]
MDVSLDEIIRTRQIGSLVKKKSTTGKPAQKKLVNRSTFKPNNFKPPARTFDARNRIIEKNRAKIRDARDKLAEISRACGDVRHRLLQKQASSPSFMSSQTKQNYRPDRVARIAPIRRSTSLGLTSKSAKQRMKRMPDMFNVPLGYVDHDNMERMEQEEYALASHLSRTVKNDIAQFGYNNTHTNVPPPAPRRLNSWGSNSDQFEPFDVYEIPRSRPERRMSVDLPPPPPKGILRSSVREQSPPSMYQRRFNPENSHLSYEMRSRLMTTPDPHASMGIFANPQKTVHPQVSPNGYRIVVSNLHTSVTQTDIQELFEDVGELYDARIVRPGIAEVVYKSLTDAEKAVDQYHNRQLDGQPMKCLLVNPRASNKPTAPALKTASSTARLASNKTPLEIDIDALHKVLFRR